MTDTARSRRRRAARDDPARAPRRRVLVGPPLHHAQRAGDRAARRGASRTPRSSGCWRRALGLDDPVLPRDRRGDARRGSSRGAPGGVTSRRCASAAGPRSTSGRAPRPHAEGGFGTADGQARAARRRARGQGIDTLPFYDPPAEVADDALARALPARADHAQDAPLPQLDVRQPGAASTRPSRSRTSSCTPPTPSRAGIADGGAVRVFNDRGSFALRARASPTTRAPGVRRRADGLVERRLRRTARARRPRRRRG